MTISPRRVAERYLTATASRLTPKAKASANASLIRAGFGGAVRFESLGKALNKAGDVLSQNGMEWGEVISSFRLQEPTGRMNIDLAFQNPADAFSPVAISNSTLAFQWHRLESGLYEVIGYLS